MTEADPTPYKPHPILPEDPGPAGAINFASGGPEALAVVRGELGPSGKPLPPSRTTLYAPWKCVACGFIYESLDEPGLACGISFGTLEVMCRACFEREEGERDGGHNGQR